MGSLVLLCKPVNKAKLAFLLPTIGISYKRMEKLHLPSDVPRHLLSGGGRFDQLTIFTLKKSQKYCFQLSCSMAAF